MRGAWSYDSSSSKKIWKYLMLIYVLSMLWLCMAFCSICSTFWCLYCLCVAVSGPGGPKESPGGPQKGWWFLHGSVAVAVAVIADLSVFTCLEKSNYVFAQGFFWAEQLRDRRRKSQGIRKIQSKLYHNSIAPLRTWSGRRPGAPFHETKHRFAKRCVAFRGSVFRQTVRVEKHRFAKQMFKNSID